MRIEHDGLHATISGEQLVCNHQTLQIGGWRTALADITHVRTSEALKFLEITTTSDTRRWYMRTEFRSGDDKDALGQIDTFLRHAVEAARAPGEAADIPQALLNLVRR